MSDLELDDEQGGSPIKETQSHTPCAGGRGRKTPPIMRPASRESQVLYTQKI